MTDVHPPWVMISQTAPRDAGLVTGATQDPPASAQAPPPEPPPQGKNFRRFEIGVAAATS
jgi:hypothetical protein